MGTGTLPFTKLGVKAEQMILFSWFRAALHPLALGHEFDTLVHFGNEYDFRFLLNFNDFLPTVLGKKYTWAHISTIARTINIINEPA
jgi:hypothetical protein